MAKRLITVFPFSNSFCKWSKQTQLQCHQRSAILHFPSNPSFITPHVSHYSAYSRSKKNSSLRKMRSDEKIIKPNYPKPDSLWLTALDTPPSQLDPAIYLPNKKSLEFIRLPFTPSEERLLPMTPEPMPPPPPKRVALYRKVLLLRKVVKMTEGGKKYSTSALTVVGNGKGCVAIGEAKAAEARDAIVKAVEQATRRMEPVDRFENRTIWSNVSVKFNATHVILRTAPPGYGIRTNPHIHEICKCVGIRDLSAKVRGSTNPINVVKATLLALNQQRRMDEVARARGLRLWDVRKVAFGA